MELPEDRRGATVYTVDDYMAVYRGKDLHVYKRIDGTYVRQWHHVFKTPIDAGHVTSILSWVFSEQRLHMFDN